jgi:hypothetical protein
VSAATIEVPELRRHLGRLIDLSTHMKNLVMWRASISEAALVLGVRGYCYHS